jgi:hypothetical protein
MPVEGRDDDVIILTVTKRFASYNEGDIAAFLPEQAQALVDEGVAVQAGPDDPPVNLVVPYATQENGTVNCTVGEWTGEPSSYSYHWTSDGEDVGDGTNPYAVTAGDVGKTVTCVVTATNDAGSGAAPPSNDVVVTEPAEVARAATHTAASHHRRRPRS